MSPTFLWRRRRPFSRSPFSLRPVSLRQSAHAARLRTIGNHRDVLGLGAKYQRAAWIWDVGLNYVITAGKTVANTALSTTDYNGTVVYNGDYEASALLYGLSLSRDF